jgi:hypothetical protein
VILEKEVGVLKQRFALLQSQQPGGVQVPAGVQGGSQTPSMRGGPGGQRSGMNTPNRGLSMYNQQQNHRIMANAPSSQPSALQNQINMIQKTKNPNIRTQTHSNAPSRQGELADYHSQHHGHGNAGHGHMNPGQGNAPVHGRNNLAHIQNMYKQNIAAGMNPNMAAHGVQGGAYQNYNRTGHSSPNRNPEMNMSRISRGGNGNNAGGDNARIGKRSSWEQENINQQQNVCVLSPDNENNKRLKY